MKTLMWRFSGAQSSSWKTRASLKTIIPSIGSKRAWSRRPLRRASNGVWPTPIKTKSHLEETGLTLLLFSSLREKRKFRRELLIRAITSRESQGDSRSLKEVKMKKSGTSILIQENLATMMPDLTRLTCRRRHTCPKMESRWDPNSCKMLLREPTKWENLWKR